MNAELISFFIVLFAGLLFSGIFKRLHLPWVVALIVGGIVIGPSFLDIFRPDETFTFLSEIGLIFLMFMAGLEIRLNSLKDLKGEITATTLLNGGIPFLVGLGIGWYFGYDITTALLLGAIFISSSIAIVIPSLEANEITGSHTGKAIVVATMIEDIVSLLLLSILLQTAQPITALPLPIFYVFLAASIFILRFVLIKIEQWLSRGESGTPDVFQRQLTSVLVLLIGTVVVFGLLGLHPIIGGFFAGLVLSGFITDDVLKGKLRAISYGIFIPIFFVVVGANTNLSVFGDAGNALILVGAILIGSVLSKFVSGFIAGRLVHGKTHRGVLIGVATIPQLSTTLAVATTGYALDLLDEKLLTALVILSVVTTVLGPLLMRLVLRSHRQSTAGEIQNTIGSTS